MSILISSQISDCNLEDHLEQLFFLNISKHIWSHGFVGTQKELEIIIQRPCNGHKGVQKVAIRLKEVE